MWSDGRAITSEDYLFTCQTIMNKNWDITSRAGYDQVSRVHRERRHGASSSRSRSPAGRTSLAL